MEMTHRLREIHFQTIHLLFLTPYDSEYDYERMYYGHTACRVLECPKLNIRFSVVSLKQLSKYCLIIFILF